MVFLRIRVGYCFTFAAFADIEYDGDGDRIYLDYPDEEKIRCIRVWDLKTVCVDKIRRILGQGHIVGEKV